MSSKSPSSLLFIDGTNLDHRLEEGVGASDVDFPKFLAALSAGTELERSYYFTASYISSPDPKRTRMRSRQMRTFNAPRKMDRVTLCNDGRYQPREGKCHHCQRPVVGHVEKGTDVHAASMLVKSVCLRLAEEFIFVADDNDYAPAFRIRAELGLPVALAYVVADESAPQSRRTAKTRQADYSDRSCLHARLLVACSASRCAEIRRPEGKVVKTPLLEFWDF